MIPIEDLADVTLAIEVTDEDDEEEDEEDEELELCCSSGKCMSDDIFVKFDQL